MMHILHLEDDKNDAELVASILKEKGIGAKINHVEDKVGFRSALNRGGMDLILADFNLPSFDGLSALAMARRKCPQIPFIFISGTIGEDTAVRTFQLGATDYVLKSDLSRLVPAVQHVLKEKSVL